MKSNEKYFLSYYNLLTPSHHTVTLPLSLQREGQSEHCELGVSKKKEMGHFIFPII